MIEASPNELRPHMCMGTISKLGFLLPSGTVEQHICPWQTDFRLRVGNVAPEELPILKSQEAML